MANIKNSIKGILVPAEWDDDGGVTRTVIMTFDEDTYVVANDSLGQILNSHVRQVITINGEVIIHGNVKHICVEQFIIQPEK